MQSEERNSPLFLGCSVDFMKCALEQGFGRRCLGWFRLHLCGKQLVTDLTVRCDVESRPNLLLPFWKARYVVGIGGNQVPGVQSEMHPIPIEGGNLTCVTGVPL